MSQYNIFQALYMSFYSGKLYRDVGQNWGGKVFLYLFFLLSITWIAPTISAQIGLNFGYAKLSSEMLGEIPVITITNGKVTTPENHPYIIKDVTDKKKPDNIFAIIDTTGQFTNLNNSQAYLLITSSKVIARHSKHEVRTYEIPANYNATYNPVTINETIKDFMAYAWIPLYFLFLVGSFCYRIIESMIYSIIGKIFSAISGSRVNYGTIFNIMMVGLTPAIVVASVCDLANLTFPKQNLFYFIISMSYMLYGIRVNKT